MDDKVRWLMFFVTFALAVSCCVISTFVLTAMIGEINRKLPDNAQIAYFGFHPGKFFRIKDEYARLYPKGKLILLLNALRVCAAVSFLLTAAFLFRWIK
jgi:hypothetical protein